MTKDAMKEPYVDLFGNKIIEEPDTPVIKSAREKGRKIYIDPITGNKRTTPPAKGYAGTPGRGPEGETCKSCEHYYRSHDGFLKCYKLKAVWTRGAGTDIKASAPACEYWEKKEGE